MHILLDVRWLVGQPVPEEVDPKLFHLLEALRADGTLVRAAESASVSYRHAWGLLRRWENRFHLSLVEMRRGRGNGARLSEFGDRLLLARSNVQERIGRELGRLGEQLSMEIAEMNRAGAGRMVRIAASHGMAVAHLVDLLRREAKFDVRLQTRGSIESLKLLARGECSVAGFHFPEERIRKALAPFYQPWLRRDRLMVLRVATRQQGLMTPRDDPRGIAALGDLAKPSVRFVNRQPDSGTRAIFDGLLRDAGIDHRQIQGYEKEEFTHLAVAAMVAGGAADAGFGIEAAAAEFNLRFVPILREGYYVALPRESLELTSTVRRILESAEFKERVRTHPGYDASAAGESLEPEDILPPR
ncbi:MAG: substrate-binding domain-containing protein [Gammaproteobacteria bacterium]